MRTFASELSGGFARRGRFGGDQVQDLLWVAIAADRGVRFTHEIADLRAEPMVATGGGVVVAHALLHDGPFTVGRQEKRMMVDAEAILHGGSVDLRGHAAVIGERFAIEAV